MTRAALRLRILLVLALALLLTAAPTVLWATDAGESHGTGEVAAEAEHGAAGGHAEAHSSVTPAKLMDFVWRSLNFLVLVVVLYIVLKKPLSSALSGRRDQIANTLKDFEQKKAAAEKRYQELEGKLADLEAERDKIIAEYIRLGEEEKVKIIAHAHTLAERIREQADKSIAQEVAQAKVELKREVAIQAAAMAEELIRKNINDRDQVRLVEEYLDKVVQN